MIIENPTYEDLCKYLGRTVTVVSKGGTKTGCLVHTCVSYSVFAAVANGKGGSRIKYNLGNSRCLYVGPKNIRAFYMNAIDRILIHEPKVNVTNKKWWLAAPLLLKALLR